MRKERPPVFFGSTPIHVVGAPRERWRDFYHRFLRATWPSALLAIVSLFLLLNAFFAVVYDLVGGIDHARPGSLTDAFFFSVQTMATIGYGHMHPVGLAANLVVVTEAV